MGYRNLNKVFEPHVIPMAEGGHYCAKEVTCLDSKATSVTRYQRRSYRRERVSERGLALT